MTFSLGTQLDDTLLCPSTNVGILSILILEDWEVYLHVAQVSLWGLQPKHGCLEPPSLSDTDATDEEVDAELLSLSNP